MTRVVCVICGQRADVILHVVLADAEGDSPWCMDCAADVVSQELAEVVGPVDKP